MTQRERVLGLCVGGALAGYALFAVGQHVLWRPIQDTQNKITDARRAQYELRKELKELKDVEKQWQEWTAKTLAADPQTAQLHFGESIHKLLQRYDLIGDPDTKETKISAGNPGRQKHTGFTDVPLTIKTSGTLKQIVGFLRDFYRQPYVARIDKVSLQGDQSVINEAAGLSRHKSSSSRRDRSSRSDRDSRAAEDTADGPLLTVSITATALVLPKIKGVDHESLALLEELDKGQLQAEDLALYDDIFKRSLFAPFKDKPIAIKQPDKPKLPEKPDLPITKQPPPPPPDPRPDAPHLYARGTSMLDGHPIVYVYHDRKKAEPPEVFAEDNEIDDGRLLLIHQRGLVVRVKKPGQAVKDYFYPLNKSFAEREELSEETHPNIWQSLQAEFLNWPDGQTVATHSRPRS